MSWLCRQTVLSPASKNAARTTGPENRDAVFEVADRLQVPAWEDDAVHRVGDGLGHQLHLPIDHHRDKSRRAVLIDHTDRGLVGDEGHRADGADEEAANVGLPTNVKALKRWRHPAP